MFYFNAIWAIFPTISNWAAIFRTSIALHPPRKSMRLKKSLEAGRTFRSPTEAILNEQTLFLPVLHFGANWGGLRRSFVY